jgi:uncharacterized protein
MYHNFFQSSSIITKLLLSVLIMFLSLIIVTVLGLFLAIPLFNLNTIDLLAVIRDMAGLDNINLLKYMQIVQSIGLFIVPPIILGYLFSTNPMRYYGFNKKPALSSIGYVVLIVLLAIPIVNFLAFVNSKMHFPEFLKHIEVWMQTMEANAEIITKKFLTVHNGWDLLINILMIAIIPAFGEELIFRGLFQRIFTDQFKNVHVAVLLSAFIFSAIHFQFYGFLPRFALGVTFGYLYCWSGTIWLPVLAHFINNLGAVIFYLIIGNNELTEQKFEDFGTGGFSLLAVVFASFVLIYLLMQIKKKELVAKVPE